MKIKRSYSNFFCVEAMLAFVECHNLSILIDQYNV